jgi:hypothetical protein
MARSPRIERGTWGLEDPCSIQLSYERFLRDNLLIETPVLLAFSRSFSTVRP